MTKKRSSFFHGNLRGAIVLLAMVAVLGVLAVKLLQSPRSSATLLDLGLSDRYEVVQQRIDSALSRALSRAGVREPVEKATAAGAAESVPGSIREWSVKVPASQSLIRLNLALSGAVERAGGTVRSCREWPRESGLTIEAGSRRYTTHRIRIQKGETASTGKALAGERRHADERGYRDAAGGVKAEEEQEGAARIGRDNGAARVALVIDDFGYARGGIIDEFLDLEVPITVSVIPTLPHSQAVLAKAADKGKEIMLHLPMEAEAFVSDVPPVLISMSSADIESLVEKYLGQLPGVAGANNHLGSAATRDERVMNAVLGVLQKRRLYFLDSLTSSKSIAYNAAGRLGVPAARNDIFIDTGTEEEAVVAGRLDQLLDTAKERGFAVGIGHPRPWTLRAILASREKARADGIEFVFLSAVVR